MALPQRHRRLLMRHLDGWLATGLGAGLAPIAPGTVGSAVALLPWLGLRALHPLLQIAAIALVFWIGTRVSARVVRRVGREDPGVIVIDEWVGQWLTLMLMELALRAAPALFGTPDLLAVLGIGFVAFRICDILKPWPASWADRRVHGGLGVMLDDALAGVWAGFLGTLALYGLARIG